MEIPPITPRIRRVLHLLVVIVPLLVIFSHGWSEVLRRLTVIG